MSIPLSTQGLLEDYIFLSHRILPFPNEALFRHVLRFMFAVSNLARQCYNNNKTNKLTCEYFSQASKHCNVVNEK